MIYCDSGVSVCTICSMVNGATLSQAASFADCIVKMATDVELGGIHDFEQVLLQNQDIAGSRQNQNLITSPCESHNVHSYGYTYILPGEDSESMDTVSPTSSSSSNESTEILHEVYFTETEVQEATQDGEGCAMELGTFCTIFPSCEHNAMECNPSENGDTGSYMLPLQTETAQFPTYRLPIDGELSAIREEEFQYDTYSWYVDPVPNEGSNVLSIHEYPTTIRNTSDGGSQSLSHSMQPSPPNHYPYEILPMESDSEPVVFQDTELLMPEEHFLTDNDKVFVTEDIINCNDVAANSDAYCERVPVTLVKQEVNNSKRNGDAEIILNSDSKLNNYYSTLAVVKKEVEMEASSEENDNCGVNFNDYTSSNPASSTVLKSAAVIAAETNNNSKSAIFCTNDSIPFNVVKEEVIDYVNGNSISENLSQCSFESYIPLTYNSESHIFELPRNELYKVERYSGQHFDYLVTNCEPKQQATELAIAGEEETDPLYFVENRSESETDENLSSSNSKKRNRKKITKKRSNGKGKTTEKLKKERKCNGQRRRGSTSTDSNASLTALVKRGVDINSLRYIVGPRLRYLSAVLEITGVKYMTDLPYEIMRRFHPTNTYRTIFKAIQPLTNSCTMAFNNIFPEEPDWNELKNLTQSQEEASFEAENGVEQQRMYFKTPFGLDLNGGNLLSIPKNSEKDGVPTYSPEIISSVGSADLNVALDLESLATSCPNTEFQDNTLPLIIRLREPKCCGLVYDTGKLIVVGAQSFDDFRKATRRFARMVQKSSNKVRLTNMSVHSYLGVAKLPFRINVTGLVQHETISQFARYDPTVLPGAMMFMRRTSIFCLIFSSGIVLMTDATSESDMKTTLDNIYPCLRLFGY